MIKSSLATRELMRVIKAQITCWVIGFFCVRLRLANHSAKSIDTLFCPPFFVIIITLAALLIYCNIFAFTAAATLPAQA